MIKDFKSKRVPILLAVIMSTGVILGMILLDKDRSKTAIHISKNQAAIDSCLKSVHSKYDVYIGLYPNDKALIATEYIELLKCQE